LFNQHVGSYPALELSASQRSQHRKALAYLPFFLLPIPGQPRPGQLAPDDDLYACLQFK